MKFLPARKFIFVALIALFPLLASASEATRRLEEKLRAQLDVMFFSDQYLLDVQKKPVKISTQKNSSNKVNENELTSLPGLAFSQRTPELADDFIDQGNLAIQAFDIFLIVDKDVSADRAKLAEELLQRLLGDLVKDERVNISVSRRALVKTLPEREKRQDGNQNAKPKDDEKPKADEKPPVPPQKGFFELLNENPEFYAKVLIVIWAAIASLVAAAALFRRLSSNAENPKPNIHEHSSGAGGGGPRSQAHQGEGGERAKRTAATKEELYSKDEAILKLISEVVVESREHPQKTALILEQWLARSFDNARYAQIYLRNCDIKTVEDICKNLHPADIETIMKGDLDGFDPFSEENVKVLELIRAEFARRASAVVSADKHDPFEFTKTFSEADWMNLLVDESEKNIATILTQVKPNRLNALFAKIDPKKLDRIVETLASVKQVTLPELEVIAQNIRLKVKSLNLNLVSKDSLATTMSQLISQTHDPARQIALAQRIHAENKELYQTLRPNILLASDVNFFTARAIKALCQSIDADTLGVAFAGLQVSMDKAIVFFPENYRTIFNDYRTQETSTHQQSEAWDRVTQKISEMVGTGLVSEQELQSARIRADAEISAEFGSEGSAHAA